MLRAFILWVARASRMLAIASRNRELSAGGIVDERLFR